MRDVTLRGTDITTTGLGFGCGGLMRTSTRRGRQALLSEAYESGIRHFDVARMYGLGAAEAELGRFIKGRRADLVVTTKFGIEVANRHGALVAMQGLARRLISLSPKLRSLARRKSGGLYAPRKYDVEAASKSLHASLRELGTDYVDIYLLHEPSLADLTDPALLEYLESARDKGLIRAYGVAGYPDILLPIRAAIGGLMKVTQIPNDIVSKQLKLFDRFDSAMITFSPYSTALEAVTHHIASDPAVAQRWSDATGCDMSKVDNVAGLLLKYCLTENRDGVVLFSSSTRRRIAAAADIAGDLEAHSESLQAFARLVDVEISGATAAQGN